MIRSVIPNNSIIDEGQVTSPELFKRLTNLFQSSDRNYAWLKANWPRISDENRGQHICISGTELFVGASRKEVESAARAKYPEDDARIVLFIHANPIRNRV